MQVGGGAAIYLQVLFIGNLPPNSKDEMGEMAEDGLIYNSSQKADRRGQEDGPKQAADPTAQRTLGETQQREGAAAGGEKRESHG